MSRFIMIGYEYVNTDTISRAWDLGEGKAKVVYKDGTTEIISNCELNHIEGEDEIIQVIPVKTPTVAVFKDDLDGKMYEEDIFYLGLTLSGEIRPMGLSDGYYSLADGVDNFVGLEEKGIERWREYHGGKPE